MLDDQQ
jgi:hypothetical protein